MPDPSVCVVARDPYARAGLEAIVQRAGLPLVEREAADVVLCDTGCLAVGAVPTLALVLDEEEAAAVLARGARGVLVRGADAGVLGAAVRALGQGLIVLDPSLPTLLRVAPRGAPVSLTPREREVLELLASGASNREIAQELGISAHTAKFHVVAILEKLGAVSRAEAVMLAARAGLLTV